MTHSVSGNPKILLDHMLTIYLVCPSHIILFYCCIQLARAMNVLNIHLVTFDEHSNQ